MTVVRADTFTRANQAGWGTASDGNTWTIQSGNGQSISSNEGLISGSTASTFATLGASLPGGDASAVVRWDINNGSSTSGIILRWTDANNWYIARFSGSGSIQFLKKVGGTTTTVGSYTFTNANNTYYWMRFQVQGSAISIRTWTDGSAEPSTWNYSVTDTSLAGTGGAANLVGLYGYGYAPGNNYDHFSVDDLASGTVTALGAGLGVGGGSAAPLIETPGSGTGAGVGMATTRLASAGAARGQGSGSAPTRLTILAGGQQGTGSGTGVTLLRVAGASRGVGSGAGRAMTSGNAAGASRGVGGGVALAQLQAQGASEGRGTGAGHATALGILAPGVVALADALLASVTLVDAFAPVGAVTLADALASSVMLADALAPTGSVALTSGALGTVALSDAA